MAGDAYPLWLYDRVHVGNDGDLDFYRRACEGCDSVLELGCGSGRVAGAIASDGARVVGIDRRADAIDRACAVGVEARLGEIANFDLGERFDRVIAPYSTLCCLLTVPALVSCLTCVRRHLAPQGRFIFDVYAADGFHHHEASEAGAGEALHVGTIDAGDARWEVFETTRWERAAQRLAVIYQHVEIGGVRVIEASIPQRYLVSHEVSEMLSRADLMLTGLHGDFAGSSFDVDSDNLVIQATSVNC